MPAAALAVISIFERSRYVRHTQIPPQETADRLAIRELVDAYAHCADRRDAKGHMALFHRNSTAATPLPRCSTT